MARMCGRPFPPDLEPQCKQMTILLPFFLIVTMQMTTLLCSLLIVTQVVAVLPALVAPRQGSRGVSRVQGQGRADPREASCDYTCKDRGGCRVSACLPFSSPAPAPAPGPGAVDGSWARGPEPGLLHARREVPRHARRVPALHRPLRTLQVPQLPAPPHHRGSDRGGGGL